MVFQGEDYLQVLRHRFLSLNYEDSMVLMDPPMYATECLGKAGAKSQQPSRLSMYS